MSGSTSDSLGDTGKYSFTLTVTSATQGDASLDLFPEHPRPLLVGASATFVARVQVTNGPNNLSGTVSFFVAGSPVVGCQNEALKVNSSSCSINFPSAGTFTVSATYGNDPNFANSTDSSSQVVNRGMTSLLLSSAAPTPPGSKVLYSATVQHSPCWGLGPSEEWLHSARTDHYSLVASTSPSLDRQRRAWSLSRTPVRIQSGQRTREIPNFTGSTAAVTQVVTSQLSITTSSLATAYDGQKYYSQTLVATGGTTPYTWSLVAGVLPKGLSLNATSGRIIGEVASWAATQTFTVNVSDLLGASTTKILHAYCAVANRVHVWRFGSRFKGSGL